ncbi:pathogenesis-related protein 1 [Granulicella rosea]|uniref:Pathogenesis-related protein 1 n=1 Tax=Granulicella rosea TaxID=474952 RepID=A0A239LUT3_9BACT|nr:CAP family protein [Granulicella rosea]SNT33563.1 pathogenesis-related protein 1 [Granulicella rosea]
MHLIRTVAATALLAAFHAGGAQESATPVVPSQTGSKISQKEAQQALDFQNAKRNDVGAPPLQWSADLAADAQAWAEHLAHDKKCQLEHKTDNSHGENLFGGTGAFYTALSASQSWYSEIKAYNGGDAITPGNAAAIGHYTQMVWKNTQKVGMGQASCGGLRGAMVIVAEYDPHGNVLGEKPY